MTTERTSLQGWPTLPGRLDALRNSNGAPCISCGRTIPDRRLRPHAGHRPVCPMCCHAHGLAAVDRIFAAADHVEHLVDGDDLDPKAYALRAALTVLAQTATASARASLTSPRRAVP